MNKKGGEPGDGLEISNQKVYFKSAEDMSEIEDESIQLVITSPPYGAIKDYGVEGQIGFKDGFERYIERLTRVWRECYRVLEPKCRLVINVGDQYLRKTEYGRYRIFSIHTVIIERCIEVGFDYLGDIIWRKISTTNPTGGCSLMGSIYYPRNGLLTYDYEHILIFKKWKGREREVEDRRKELSKICLDEWKRWFGGHWVFPGVLQKEHVAMFPEELPYRIIRMFSFVEDTILDPFVGSGTTLKVAEQLNRRGIGYEINREFRAIIEKKIKTAAINTRRDFHNLMVYFEKNERKKNLKFNFKLSKKKGYIVISSNNFENNVAIDLLITDGISEKEHMNALIEKKLKENTVRNFLNQENGNKNEMLKKFIIVLTCCPEIFDKLIRLYNNKFQDRVLLIKWDDFYDNEQLLKKILSDEKIIDIKEYKKFRKIDQYF